MKDAIESMRRDALRRLRWLIVIAIALNLIGLYTGAMSPSILILTIYEGVMLYWVHNKLNKMVIEDV